MICENCGTKQTTAEENYCVCCGRAFKTYMKDLRLDVGRIRCPHCNCKFDIFSSADTCIKTSETPKKRILHMAEPKMSMLELCLPAVGTVVGKRVLCHGTLFEFDGPTFSLPHGEIVHVLNEGRTIYVMA